MWSCSEPRVGRGNVQALKTRDVGLQTIRVVLNGAWSIVETAS